MTRWSAAVFRGCELRWRSCSLDPACERRDRTFGWRSIPASGTMRPKPEERYRLEPAHGWTPDRVFERQWAETVLARTLDRLEADYADQAMRFAELKVFLVGAKGSAPYAEVAARLAVSEGALKLAVHR